MLDAGLMLAIEAQQPTGGEVLPTREPVALHLQVTATLETSIPGWLSPVFPVAFGTGDGVVNQTIERLAAGAAIYAQALAVLETDPEVDKVMDALLARHTKGAKKTPLKRKR